MPFLLKCHLDGLAFSAGYPMGIMATIFHASGMSSIPLSQLLKVTERQYETMVFITGNQPAYDEVDTMEEFLVL